MSDSDSSTCIDEVKTNEHGGFYVVGKRYSDDRYLSFIETYHDLKDELKKLPSIRQLAKRARISFKTARRTIQLVKKGMVSFPKRGHGREGVGSIKQLTDEEEDFLLELLENDPSRSLDTYRIAMIGFSGKHLSKSFLSLYWKKRYKYAANFRKHSVYQPRKYTTENILRLLDFIDNVKDIDPDRIVFTDEKPLRGMDIYDKKVRRHPITGTVPSLTANADIRNQYTIFCAIRQKEMHGYNPVQYRMGEFTGDSEKFDAFIIDDLAETGFLREGDVLIADNARIHTGGYCSDLVDRLYNNYGVYLIFQPAFSPELNPTELVFNTLVQRMRSQCFRAICQDGDSLLDCASDVLDDVTLDDVLSMYRYCGYK